MKRKLLSALLCLSCLLPCTSSWAYTPTYTITAEELQRWQAELTLQKQLLIKQKKVEQELRQELSALRHELEMQKLLLTSSSEALQDANKSLMKYEQEEKQKQKRLERQRNLAWGVAGALAIGFILK